MKATIGRRTPTARLERSRWLCDQPTFHGLSQALESRWGGEAPLV